MTKFLLLFVTVVMPSISYAASYDLESGVPITIQVRAEVDQTILVPTLEECSVNNELEGCDLLVPFEGNPRHFCEDHPDARGCKFYKPEE